MRLPKIPRWVVGLSAVGTSVGVIVLTKDAMGGETYDGEDRIPGRTVVITGANSGIGRATAHELAKRGGRVLMACRDLEKCEAVRQEIIDATFNKNVQCKKLDLASLASIQEFANDINKTEPRLDILINNAGVMGIQKFTPTVDGFETHLGVNHLGHFLLTKLLLDKLKSSSPSRIINLSTVSHRWGRMNWKDLNQVHNYSYKGAYAQSKLATILFTKELTNQLEGTGVTTYCVNPGIARTRLGRHLGMENSYSSYILSPLWSFVMKTPEQAMQTVIMCAVAPELEKQSGEYYEECVLSQPEQESLCISDAKRLWAISEVWTSTRLEEINNAKTNTDCDKTKTNSAKS